MSKSARVNPDLDPALFEANGLSIGWRCSMTIVLIMLRRKSCGLFVLLFSVFYSFVLRESFPRLFPALVASGLFEPTAKANLKLVLLFRLHFSGYTIYGGDTTPVIRSFSLFSVHSPKRKSRESVGGICLFLCRCFSPLYFVFGICTQPVFSH